MLSCLCQVVQDDISSKTVVYLFSITYNVMQSDGNIFCGDVVLDNFHQASLDEATFQTKICLDCYYEDFDSL